MQKGSRPDLRFPDGPKLELDQLIDQLVERAQDVKRVQGRLRALLRAIDTFTGDLSLDTMLHNLVVAAQELARADYAALGVIAADGGLEHFVHVGMDDDTVARIGNLPQGRGLLRALVDDPRPIRLEKLGDDPRAVGLPAGHAPMSSFLGVPIRVGNAVFGNLYLANGSDDPFTAEDEELVSALALFAGNAISNARLYQESRRQQKWLQASAEISALLLDSRFADPLDTIVLRAKELADADLTALALVGDDGTYLTVEAATGDGADFLKERRMKPDESFAGQVLATGAPVVMDTIAQDPARAVVVESVMAGGPVMAVPLQGTQAVRGVLGFVRRSGRRPFSESDSAMAHGFATHASLSLELADARAAEQRMLLLEDRDRIARDLHDHVIQELFAIGLGLQGTAAGLGSGSPVAERLLDRVDDLDRVIRRLRTSIFGLHAELDADPIAVRLLVRDVVTESTALLGLEPTVRYTGAKDLQVSVGLADDITACLRETLTNVAKHASAHAVDIAVDIDAVEGWLTITVTDDGVGCGTPTRTSGTRNLLVRAERNHGTFTLTPGSDGGSVATWRVRIHDRRTAG